MGGGSQKGSRIIGYACLERREHDRYALWWDTGVEAEQTWHCEVCGTCRDWREEPCEACNRWTYGVSLPLFSQDTEAYPMTKNPWGRSSDGCPPAYTAQRRDRGIQD